MEDSNKIEVEVEKMEEKRVELPMKKSQNKGVVGNEKQKKKNQANQRVNNNATIQNKSKILNSQKPPELERIKKSKSI